MDNKTLGILHEQLQTLLAFVADTPTYGAPYRTFSWWAGDLPASPELYDPADWEKSNRPIWYLWEEYLFELKKFDKERVKQARQLPIADLLAITSAWDAE